MGVEDYLLTSTINGILAQRLVRRLCRHCREAYPALPEVVEELQLARFSDVHSSIMLYRPVGCAECGHTGYRGRISILECLLITDPIRTLVMRHASSQDIQQVALQEGMQTMYEDGLRKVVAGLTTIEEVLRVTQES
jgi:general secretion pathway protein E